MYAVQLILRCIEKAFGSGTDCLGIIVVKDLPSTYAFTVSATVSSSSFHLSHPRRLIKGFKVLLPSIFGSFLLVASPSFLTPLPALIEHLLSYPCTCTVGIAIYFLPASGVRPLCSSSEFRVISSLV